MKTEQLANMTMREVDTLYRQAVISQSQYEAFDFAFVAAHFEQARFPWANLCADGRDEFWKLYHALPAKTQKIIRPIP